MQHKVIISRSWALALFLSAIIIGISLFSRAGKFSSAIELGSNGESLSAFEIDKGVLSAQIGQAVQANHYPESFNFDFGGKSQKAHVEYAMDEVAQARMLKLLNQYKPDYGAFIAMDASTGRILAMASFSDRIQDENLTLRASFPAASVFKIVTAGAAIDLNKAGAATVVPFNGSNHTLYKKNVQETRINRWTRKMTLREAFARSANVFFGKLGLFYVGPENLKMYAERFHFNSPIRADFPVETGYARFSSEDPWSVVTAASGFTRENTMSPMHGAMIAAAVANDGVMMEPYIVEELVSDSGTLLYRAEPRKAAVVVEPRTAVELRELFRQTVHSGTSRQAFRQTVRRGKFNDVEFGGKTGSLTGQDPFGKCDWFVGYALYGDRRIAVAALTVNEKKWKVKSSTLANLFFTQYLQDIKKRELASLKH